MSTDYSRGPTDASLSAMVHPFGLTAEILRVGSMADVAQIHHARIAPDSEDHVVAQFTEDEVGIGEVFHETLSFSLYLYYTHTLAQIASRQAHVHPNGVIVPSE